MGEELDHVRTRQHLGDPVHAVAGAAQLVDEFAELPLDLRGVGGSCAQDELCRRIQEPGRAQQVRDALLPGDAADEEGVRALLVDPGAPQYVRGGVGPVERGVDAVVHDPYAGRVERRIAAEDVGAHAVRDGDDGVGRLDRGALGPAGQGVAAAQLLGLPGAQGLQRVRGHDVRDAVQQLPEVAREVGVPGVGVEQVAPFQGRRHRQVDGEGAQGVVRTLQGGVGAVAQYAVVFRGAGACTCAGACAPAVHLHVDEGP